MSERETTAASPEEVRLRQRAASSFDPVQWRREQPYYRSMWRSNKEGELFVECAGGELELIGVMGSEEIAAFVHLEHNVGVLHEMLLRQRRAQRGEPTREAYLTALYKSWS